MVVTFLSMIGISGALRIPAWRFSKRKGSQTKWLLFLSTPALLLWIVLTAAGLGAQSLANIIEVFPIAGLGVVAAYLRVFLLDGITGKPKENTRSLILALMALALVLRLFMPTLPE